MEHFEPLRAVTDSDDLVTGECEGTINVSTVTEDEFEIPELAAAFQVRDAFAHHEIAQFGPTPLVDDVAGFSVLRSVSRIDKTRSNPAAAHLIFFPKLTAGSSAHHSDGRPVALQPAHHGPIIAETCD